jgi:hypothetical protein
MSTKTTVNCDLCGVELLVDAAQKSHGRIVPVRFTTEQTEGRSIEPYLSNEKLDLCLSCMKHIVDELPLGGHGAMGGNTYYWRNRK